MDLEIVQQHGKTPNCLSISFKIIIIFRSLSDPLLLSRIILWSFFKFSSFLIRVINHLSILFLFSKSFSFYLVSKIINMLWPFFSLGRSFYFQFVAHLVPNRFKITILPLMVFFYLISIIYIVFIKENRDVGPTPFIITFFFHFFFFKKYVSISLSTSYVSIKLHYYLLHVIIFTS